MKISESSRIDKDATLLLKKLLPTPWLIREQNPDIGIDYVVEIAEVKETPSGIKFCVQQKGTESPKYTHGGTFISMPLEREYIEYYLEKIRQPVFFVIVDLMRKEAYWLFMQQWACEDQYWRTKAKPTVKIPCTNRVSDTAKLKAAIISAEEYMRELWPSSIQAAIRGEKEKLEKLDPRISVVDVEVKNGVPTFHLGALEPIPLRLEWLKGHDLAVKSRIEQLIDLGSPAKFGSDEIRVEGSKIFDQRSQMAIEVGSTHQLDSEVKLISVNSAGRELETIAISGKTTTGRKGGHFQSDPKKMPLQVSLPFGIEKQGTDLSLKPTFFIEPKAWEGLPVSRLPYFEKLASVFRSVATEGRVKIVYSIEGHFIFSSHATPLGQQFVEALGWYLDVLHKARAVAQEVKINPKVPDLSLVGERDFQEIDSLYHLTTEGTYRQPAGGGRFDTRIVFHERGLKYLSGNTDNWLAFRTEQAMTFTLFGTEIPLKVRLELTKARFQGDLSLVTSEDQKTLEEGLPCAWVGAPDSELVITLLENPGGPR